MTWIKAQEMMARPGTTLTKLKGNVKTLLMVGMEGIPTTFSIWKLAPVLALVAKTRMLEQMMVPSRPSRGSTMTEHKKNAWNSIIREQEGMETTLQTKLIVKLLAKSQLCLILFSTGSQHSMKKAMQEICLKKVVKQTMFLIFQLKTDWSQFEISIVI